MKENSEIEVQFKSVQDVVYAITMSFSVIS